MASGKNENRAATVRSGGVHSTASVWMHPIKNESTYIAPTTWEMVKDYMIPLTI